MSNLSPPPVRDPDFTSHAWQRWFTAIQALLSPISSGGLMLWNSVSKVKSNITDIETRNHDDLQNINTAAHTHLSATNAGLLTAGNDTTLHYHLADRTSAASLNQARITATLRL